MKIGHFFLLIMLACSTSCTSTQEQAGYATVQDMENNFVKKYKDYPGYLPPGEAVKYIGTFKKHRYRGLRKNQLQVVRSTFVRGLMRDLANDEHVDSIYYYMAAFPKEFVSKDSSLFPFVMMQVVPKNRDTLRKDKYPLPPTTAIFFMPAGLCPPPGIGCRIVESTD